MEDDFDIQELVQTLRLSDMQKRKFGMLRVCGYRYFGGTLLLCSRFAVCYASESELE